MNKIYISVNLIHEFKLYLKNIVKILKYMIGEFWWIKLIKLIAQLMMYSIYIYIKAIKQR